MKASHIGRGLGLHNRHMYRHRHRHMYRSRHRHRHRHMYRHCACNKYAHARARVHALPWHTCSRTRMRTTCGAPTPHTHTHVHTAGCPRACACTGSGASSPPIATHRADTPTDQGHSTRSLVCCTACTSASVPAAACPAKNFAPLGPRAAFLSVCLSVRRTHDALTDLSTLARPLQKLFNFSN